MWLQIPQRMIIGDQLWLHAILNLSLIMGTTTFLVTSYYGSFIDLLCE